MLSILQLATLITKISCSNPTYNQPHKPDAKNDSETTRNRFFYDENDRLYILIDLLFEGSPLINLEEIPQKKVEYFTQSGNSIKDDNWNKRINQPFYIHVPTKVKDPGCLKIKLVQDKELAKELLGFFLIEMEFFLYRATDIMIFVYYFKEHIDTLYMIKCKGVSLLEEYENYTDDALSKELYSNKEKIVDKSIKHAEPFCVRDMLVVKQILRMKDILTEWEKLQDEGISKVNVY